MMKFVFAFDFFRKGKPFQYFLLLFVLLIISINGCVAPETNNGKDTYNDVKAQLLSGWNTFNTWNSLSYVYMPSGFELAFDLKYQAHNYSGYLQHANFSENEKGRPQLSAKAHAWDGSYTRIEVDWHKIHVAIETATQGADLVVLITPLHELAYPSSVVVRSGFAFNKPGKLYREEQVLVGESKDDLVRVFPVTTTQTDYAVNASTPYLVFGLEERAAVSTGKKRSFEEVVAIVDRRKSEYEQKANDISPALGEVYKAITTSMAWNTIYDPKHDRVLSTVSRTWNISRGGYGLFCWDNFFMAYMAAIDNKSLAFANVIELLNDRTPEGFVPNNSQGNGRQSQDRSQPPVGGIITKEIYKKYPERWFLEAVFDPLLTWNRWWMKRRFHKGLLCWGSHQAPNPWNDKALNNHLAAALESGLDDSPMFENVPFDADLGIMLLHDVGLNSLYVADCKALAEIAELLGRHTEACELKERAQIIGDSLKTLWNEEAGIFMNRRTDTGEFYGRLSPTLFYPLLAGLATQEQARRMTDHYFYGPDYFWGDYIMPSIARNDPAFPHQKYWKGAIWAPLNFLVYLGIRNYDLPDARKDLADKSLELFLGEWNRKGFISENYSAFDGTGDDPRLKSHPFYSWGALLGMIQMIEKGIMPPPESSLNH